MKKIDVYRLFYRHKSRYKEKYKTVAACLFPTVAIIFWPLTIYSYYAELEYFPSSATAASLATFLYFLEKYRLL